MKSASCFLQNTLFIGLLFLCYGAYTQPDFSSANPISGASTSSVGTGDFNGDGHVDIAVAGATQRWYEGPDFTTSHILGFSDGGPYAAAAADVNGDGWVDFVTSDGARNEGPGELYLYLHPGNATDASNEWERITIYSLNVYHQNDMRIVDMDQDGRLDVIVRTWSSNRVAIAFQNADINNWTARTFDTGETGKPEGISAGDIDGDGEQEMVLSGVYWDNPTGWRTGTPVEYEVDPEFIQEEVKSEVVDIDGDGDNDIYMGSAEKGFVFLAWYENTGVNPDGGVNLTRHMIKDNFGKCHMVKWADMDLDGDLDLCTGQSFGETGCLIFYNNNNGTSWTEQDYDPSGGLYTGVVVDLDNDGDLDVVGPNGFYDPVFVYYNQLFSAGSPVDPPVAPTNLMGTLDNGVSVSLSWTDNSDNESGFQLERNDGSAWQLLQLLPAETTVYVDNNTLPGTNYQYRVRAINAAGTSDYTNTLSFTTWSQAGVVTIAPSGGMYLNPPTISFSATAPFDEIRYTTDGSEPDASSLLYSAPFVLTASVTIKAKTFGTNLLAGPTATETYVVAVNGNFPPVAATTADTVLSRLDTIALSGLNTTDGDDPIDSLTFNWMQLSGPTVSLINSDSTVAHFIPEERGSYCFELTVMDEAVSDKDTIKITVVDIAEGLLAYWPLDDSTGNVALELINEQHGTLLNDTTWLPAGGQLEGALEFDGIDDIVTIDSLDIPGNQMSISFWIRPNNFDSQEGRFISKADGTSEEDHYWMVSQLNGSRLRFRLKTDNGGTTTLTAAAGLLTLDTWQFVTVTYDSTFMRIYLDGSEVINTPKTGNIVQAPLVKVGIGNQPVGTGIRPYAGLMDDVRIYDRALSLDEIIELYNTPEIETLPLDWVYFNATTAEKGVELEWGTAAEIDNAYFIIERSQGVEDSFDQIGTLESQGDFEGLQNYSWIDTQPKSGPNYYRLRQVDLDGKESFSKIVQVNWGGEALFRLFPNPAEESVYFRTLNSAVNEIELLDQNGKETRKIRTNSNIEQIDLSNLPSGVYWVRIYGTNRKLIGQQKLVIK